MKNSLVVRSGLIYYNGNYPVGSWPNRIRHISKGLLNNYVSVKIIISWPPPKTENKNFSESFVKFLWKENDSTYKKVKQLFYYLIGNLKGYLYLKSTQKVNFVIFAQGSFLECFLILHLCKKRKIKFILDLVDENSKKYFNKKNTILDNIARLNKELYDKYIVPKSDHVFVISSFLENKYKSLYPNISISRSAPSMIDIDLFNSRINFDINRIGQKNINMLLKEDFVKITYAGSIVRLNGIEFFLKVLADIIKKDQKIVKVFIFAHMGDKNKLIEIVKRLCILNNVLIFDPILPNMLPSIYNNSDILFIPEHGNVIANAGFPGKTAELLASGKAIISTRFSDLDNYLINGFNSMTSQINDFHDYRANLIRLIDNKSLRKYLGENAKATARKYFDYKNAIKIFLKKI